MHATGVLVIDEVTMGHRVSGVRARVEPKRQTDRDVWLVTMATQWVTQGIVTHLWDVQRVKVVTHLEPTDPNACVGRHQRLVQALNLKGVDVYVQWVST